MREANFTTHHYKYVTVSCDCGNDVIIYNNCGGKNTCECGVKFEVFQETCYTLYEDGKIVYVTVTNENWKTHNFWAVGVMGLHASLARKNSLGWKPNTPLQNKETKVKDKNGKTLMEKICLNCGNFYYARPSRKTKYCSIACFQSSSRNRVEVECSLCGASVERAVSKLSSSRSGLFFCSRACKQKAQRKQESDKFDKIRPAHYHTGTRNYRQLAFETKEKVCERCGYRQVPEILQVHHKDKNRTNNEIGNLEILCPNCHAIEHYARLA